ncbi:Ada metal-binding domain-containing protein [Microbispora bryophytorum]|uniref:Ada DNA repair metal-binding domain-containing protein n=1 Tax=Microbispora bryophytorum TaxID=1460882 RepID=A0A8H9LB07_9ACTN|nr:hypothetical protein [Microbispora bryophytorum]TQS08686.1 hypothetical protein FLX07_05390 [Microbispora bryophytorum]GGO10733.1 hypothetical protein GCM10011574_27600 [Microbispora bryophytorum]
MHLYREHCVRAVQSRDARFDGRLYPAILTTRIYCRPSSQGMVRQTPPESSDTRLKRVSKPLPVGAAHMTPARAGACGGK